MECDQSEEKIKNAYKAIRFLFENNQFGFSEGISALSYMLADMILSLATSKNYLIKNKSTPELIDINKEADVFQRNLKKTLKILYDSVLKGEIKVDIKKLEKFKEQMTHDQD